MKKDELSERDKKFELFKNSFMKYMDMFGIKDFETKFMIDDNDNERDSKIKINNTSGIVFVFMCKALYEDGDYFSHNYDKVAFHESVEVLCEKTFGYLMEVFYSDDTCQKANHEIIRTMENVIYPLISIDKK